MFVSCVRASGRGEVVWVFVNAGAQNGEKSSSPAVVVPFAFLLVIYMGFKLFSWKSLLFT